MSYTVAPPAVNPWEVALVASQALQVLRLDVGDPDAPRVAELAETACDLIDTDLDRTDPLTIIAAPLLTAAVEVTIELYRRKDAPFGVLDSWSADGTAVRIPADPLRAHRAVLSRYKQREGVA